MRDIDRLHQALDNDSSGLDHIRVGEFIPEPRRYPAEPWRDNEGSLSEAPEDKYPGERQLDTRFSESLRHTHRAQAESRRRELFKRVVWVAVMSVCGLVAIYVIASVAGFITWLVTL